jgi:heptose I phosphotransferase
MPLGSLWQRLFRGSGRFLQRSDWTRFAGTDPARIMDQAVTDRFHAKQGRSTGRWVLEKDGSRLVVYLKRHYRLPWWQRLAATLWPGRGWSPALMEWHHLQWAKAQGIPVPEAVAAGEWVGPWLGLRSYLAVEELRDLLPLHEAIPEASARLAPADFRAWKRSLLREVARLTALLHRARRYHKDLYLCHFYAAPAGSAPEASHQGRVVLIDLHRLGHHPWTGRRWQVKDLAQLLFSADVPGLDDRDRLYFFRHYRTGRKLDRTGRRLLGAVLRKAGQYRRHNEKRERGPALA